MRLPHPCATLLLAALIGGCATPAPQAVPRLPDPRLSHPEAPLSSANGALDPKPADWRESNAQVERLGGHAGHLRAQPRGSK